MPVTDPVARRFDAYNAHDLEDFLSCYAEDVVIFSGTGEVLLSGIQAVRQQYGELFDHLVDLRAEVLHRLRRGSWVVDDERATAATAGFEMTALVAYHVRGDVIDRVVLMNAESTQ